MTVVPSATTAVKYSCRREIIYNTFLWWIPRL